MRASYLFTSESVSEGHPDKVCDRISDEIVDLFFREGPEGRHRSLAIRAACETLATTNKVVIAGETRGPASVTNEQIESVVREAIKDIGYEQEGFPLGEGRHRDPAASAVADIAQGVDALQPGEQQGRGRGRPGHHVRLRHQRDAGPDAGADLLRPQDPAADLGSASLRQGEGAGSGLQEPGHRAI
jgi:S-adenosylmethionine synthetase